MRNKKLTCVVLGAFLMLLLLGPAMLEASNDVSKTPVKKRTYAKEQVQLQSKQDSKKELVPRANKLMATKLDLLDQETQQLIKQKIKNKLKGQVKKEFKDTADHWARKDIAKAQALGLLNGYGDGLFKPEAPINSVEAMVVAVRLAETVTGEVYGNNLTNNKSSGNTDKALAQFPDWAKTAAQKALANQIININRFHSHVQATRAQVAVMLARALGLQPVQSASLVFKDAVLLSKEEAGYIIALYEAGVVKGTPDGRLNPNSAITRAEFAALLARLTSVVEEKLGIEEEDVQESSEQNNEQNQQVSEQTGEQAGEQASEQNNEVNEQTTEGATEQTTEQSSEQVTEQNTQTVNVEQ